jgi:hypothetical protein
VFPKWTKRSLLFDDIFHLPSDSTSTCCSRIDKGLGRGAIGHRPHKT